ncbi:MAG: ABC transporter permease [Coriobacteriia bacterium]|nr:ABC transporter permease [Coriobacteriia bacterium]
MSWTVLRASLWQRRTSLAWYVSGLLFYSWIMVWYWPNIGGEEYQKLVESLPPEMLKMLGGTQVSFGTIGGFFQIEYLGLMWMLIVFSAVFIYASRAFAGEIADGTMELTLAQPVSRVRVGASRVVGLVAISALLALATFGSIQAFGPAYGVKLGAEALWTLTALGTLFMLAAGGICMLISAAVRGGGKAGGIAAGIVALMWVSDFVANVSDVADFFGPVNLVSAWQPGVVMDGGQVKPEAWWLYGLVALLTLAGSVAVFSRRDAA